METETRSVIADFRARKTKKEAIPINMEIITANKLKIPQFIPWAIGASDAPKQVAQAITDDEPSKEINEVKINNLAQLIDN